MGSFDGIVVLEIFCYCETSNVFGSTFCWGEFLLVTTSKSTFSFFSLEFSYLPSVIAY